MITRTEIKELITTIALLNSMVESGEYHSDTSKEKVKKCLDFLNETDALIPKLELVSDSDAPLRKASYVTEYHIYGNIEYAIFNNKWVRSGDVLENEEGEEFTIIDVLSSTFSFSTIATIRPKPKIRDFLYRKYSVS